MRRIDLNADMGESFGAWTMGDDAAMLGLVTTANVACGYHAGDPAVMHRTVTRAKAEGVAVGAHPGFHDLFGFGRRPIQGESPDDVADARERAQARRERQHPRVDLRIDRVPELDQHARVADRHHPGVG